ncbi:hypothetical protein ACU3L3_13610 [Priestia endophytica]
MIGIEHVLRIANVLVDEVADLQAIKEDYIRLKEQLFSSQITGDKRQFFEFTLNQCSVRETAKVLYKE